MNMLLYALSGFLSGLIGSMGIGGGGILIIYLTVFASVGQSRAQGINLLFFLPIALISILLYSRKKLISWGTAIPMSALAIIGSVIGFWVLSSIDTALTAKIFGWMLILMGLKELFVKGKETKYRFYTKKDKLIVNRKYIDRFT